MWYRELGLDDITINPFEDVFIYSVAGQIFTDCLLCTTRDNTKYKERLDRPRCHPECHLCQLHVMWASLLTIMEPHWLPAG